MNSNHAEPKSMPVFPLRAEHPNPNTKLEEFEILTGIVKLFSHPKFTEDDKQSFIDEVQAIAERCRHTSNWHTERTV